MSNPFCSNNNSKAPVIQTVARFYYGFNYASFMHLFMNTEKGLQIP